MATRAVIVHSRDHARAALTAARDLDVAVILASPPGFAAYGGAGFFARMITAAREGLEDVRYDAVLDCGDGAGHALAALREGVTAIAIRLPAERRARLAEIAATYGAEIRAPVRGGLDLLREDDPAAACRAWLAGGGR
jgi:fructose/tagatose bisphosphate aldolase